MQAINNWVQVQVESKTTGFQVSDSSLLEGKVVSVDGEFIKSIKKGETVLFPAQHGKVMQHSIKGVKYYFVDKDIILAHE